MMRLGGVVMSRSKAARVRDADGGKLRLKADGAGAGLQGSSAAEELSRTPRAARKASVCQ